MHTTRDTQYCFCGWPDERLLTVDAWAPQARDYVAPCFFPRRFSLAVSLSCLLSPLLSSRSPFLSSRSRQAEPPSGELRGRLAAWRCGAASSSAPQGAARRRGAAQRRGAARRLRRASEGGAAAAGFPGRRSGGGGNLASGARPPRQQRAPSSIFCFCFCFFLFDFWMQIFLQIFSQTCFLV